LEKPTVVLTNFAMTVINTHERERERERPVPPNPFFFKSPPPSPPPHLSGRYKPIISSVHHLYFSNHYLGRPTRAYSIPKVFENPPFGLDSKIHCLRVLSVTSRVLSIIWKL
jgi:hypothetical protein